MKAHYGDAAFTNRPLIHGTVHQVYVLSQTDAAINTIVRDYLEPYMEVIDDRVWEKCDDAV